MRLPPPDQYGNYWLGRLNTVGGHDGPAIFPSKRVKHEEVVNTGEFILFLGADKGFLFAGPQLKRFSTARAALAELENAA